MKDNKTLITIVIVLGCAFLFSFFLKTDYKKLTTDSGFDSSWDSSGSSDSGSSWSSDSSSGDGVGSNVTIGNLIFFGCVLIGSACLVGVSFAGYGIRRLCRKKKEGETMTDDVMQGFLVLFPVVIAVISSSIIFNYNVFIGLLIMTLLFFIINILRNKSLLKYFVVEFLIILISIIVFLILSNQIEFLLLLFFFLSPILLLAFIIFLLFVFTKIGVKNNNIENHEELINNNKKLLQDYNLDYDKLIKDSYDIYVRVQEAWMNDKIEEVNDCLSDEMKNMYEAQLLTMRRKSEQNMMLDIKFVSGDIANVKEVKNNIEIVVFLRVTCRDYLIDKKTNDLLRGNKNKINDYYYELVFLINREKPKNCPNCGEYLPKGGGVTCPSCKSKIVLNNGNMMMIKKTMKSQK